MAEGDGTARLAVEGVGVNREVEIDFELVGATGVVANGLLGVVAIDFDSLFDEDRLDDVGDFVHALFFAMVIAVAHIVDLVRGAEPEGEGVFLELGEGGFLFGGVLGARGAAESEGREKRDEEGTEFHLAFPY